MSKLKKSDVLHIAKLAKLKLAKSEIDKFSKQLSMILEYVNKLSEIETSDVIPASQTIGLANVFREDKEDKSRYIKRGRHFKVKAILYGFV